MVDKQKLNIKLPGRRKTRFMDGVEEDIQRDHLTEEDFRDRGRLRQVSCCGAP